MFGDIEGVQAEEKPGPTLWLILVEAEGIYQGMEFFGEAVWDWVARQAMQPSIVNDF